MENSWWSAEACSSNNGKLDTHIRTVLVRKIEQRLARQRSCRRLVGQAIYGGWQVAVMQTARKKRFVNLDVPTGPISTEASCILAGCAPGCLSRVRNMPTKRTSHHSFRIYEDRFYCMLTLHIVARTYFKTVWVKAILVETTPGKTGFFSREKNTCN